MRVLPGRLLLVHADSRLAEHLCGVQVMGLTEPRARELIDFHSEHQPDDCQVHLASLELLHLRPGQA
ncbi:hypothetical protein [Nocardia bovistercoris]|uniref:Uncharacterized protein n=1 Tax=Nocardia bovistercoris TaxID=2785916 RepID=A0A931IH86_9NOCA|nr:hypothetical protein [Nocardia bovistercoris]MBH0781331.1 hypothetical protein [Nocardia bovistercoris]